MLKTVFVVDDSITNLAMAEETLDEHYRVITMTSAVKMFSILEKITPDLILLDVAMPEMNGFEAIARLKSCGRYSDIPVMFLTALTDSYNESQGIELGAADFITKPFSPSLLLHRVKYHIDISELIRERAEWVDLADAAHSAKGDFLSFVSHEVRTPLNAIIDIAVTGKVSDDKDEKTQALSKIENATKQLLGIINEMLEAAKSKTNEINEK